MTGPFAALRAGLTGYRGYKQRRLSAKINSILTDPTSPDAQRAEADFLKLQSEYPPVREYGYDLAHFVERAATRISHLMSVAKSADKALSILELGGGDGMMGALLSAAGHSVTLSDIEDWRVDAARHVKFVQADCTKGIPLPDHSFDLVCSYNSFEHFAQPQVVADEIRRVLKPGGLAHLHFGPLFGSPWGLHAYRVLRMPYPQFLFSEQFLKLKREELDPMHKEFPFVNGWKPKQFDELWPDVLESKNSFETSYLSVIQRYSECFRGRGLSFDDVTRASIMVTFKV